MKTPEQLSKEKQTVPYHLAIIMDGNGRWAQAQGKERVYGHLAGVESVRRVLKHAAKRGIKVLTLYTFSEENWNRPAEEVEALMQLLVKALRDEMQEMMQNGVRLTAIGELHKLPQKAYELLMEVMKESEQNTEITLQLALSYSSRLEIVNACRQLLQSGISPQDLDEARLEQYLYTAQLPDPDLLVRTGGEHRLSNYLLWQSAYTELYFCNTPWPDFDEAALDEALADYASRERRYGKTSAQISKNE